MFKFGRQSKERLIRVNAHLRAVLTEAIRTCPIDFTILWGYRGERDQNIAYAVGNSKVKWPNSQHNKIPARAVDFAPWYAEEPHIRWEESEDFAFVAGYIVAVGEEMGVKIRWGGFFTDLDDFGHLELEG
jgi:peptidoglycan L-alanyl-D-glutamate endopeptidase CwlK